MGPLSGGPSECGPSECGPSECGPSEVHTTEIQSPSIIGYRVVWGKMWGGGVESVGDLWRVHKEGGQYLKCK